MKNKITLTLAICCLLAFLPTLRADEARSPNTFVLLIGINKYPPEMTSLSYCVRDTEGLAKSLQKIGVPAEQVIVMVDDAKEITRRPSHANIMRQIDTITDLVTEDDQIIITFSGHGVQVDGKAYLCPNDVNQTNAATLIPRLWVFEKLEKCKAKRKLFISDACRNEVMVPGAKSLVGMKSLADPLGDAESSGFFILSSCSPKQYSWEEPDFGHGVFTYFVMQGLEGAADADKDSRVTFEELYKYVMTNTRSHVLKTRQVAQVPMRGGEYSGEFVLASLPKMTLLELPKPAVVPPIPKGRRVNVATPEQLSAAVKDAKDGDVIVLEKGTYSLSGDFMIKEKKATTLYGDPENPANVKIRVNKMSSFGAERCSQIQWIGLDIFREGEVVFENSQASIMFCHIHGSFDIDTPFDGTLDLTFDELFDAGLIATAGEDDFAKTVVDNCVIADNLWGILSLDTELTVNNCSIKNNLFGIGDDFWGSNGNRNNIITLTGCDINNDGIGVAATNSGTFITMTGCKIQNNKGGICLDGGANGEFRNNILSDNEGGNWHFMDAGKVTRVGNTPNE